MTSAGEEALLDAAVALLNEGRPLAAHELLDELWEGTEGPESNFYKGLIQAAVALHHLGSGNLEGALGLNRGARRLLAGYLPVHRGLDLTAFLAALERRLRSAVDPGAPAAPEPRLERATRGPSSAGEADPGR